MVCLTWEHWDTVRWLEWARREKQEEGWSETSSPLTFTSRGSPVTPSPRPTSTRSSATGATRMARTQCTPCTASPSIRVRGRKACRGRTWAGPVPPFQRYRTHAPRSHTAPAYFDHDPCAMPCYGTLTTGEPHPETPRACPYPCPCLHPYQCPYPSFLDQATAPLPRAAATA